MPQPIRLRRLLQPKSGRSFVVALDHGFFAVPADLAAIEDLAGRARRGDAPSAPTAC